ncbi:MAG: hypothetical protein KHY83_02070 [Coriobacteriia bacterium]|nr:hypothetical protein [Coriobacteriia bacterium]MBS5477439.1 hypothetical protein [Coriobacteriia bacterium]
MAGLPAERSPREAIEARASHQSRPKDVVAGPAQDVPEHVEDRLAVIDRKNARHL